MSLVLYFAESMSGLISSRCIWFVSAAVVVACVAQVRAELILDDFNEPFELILPRDISTGFPLQQPNIGPLAATRLPQVSALLAQPVGTVDAAISDLSLLTFRIERLNKTVQNAPDVTANIGYSLNETDITQGGLNDRVLIDFGSLRSPAPLARLSIFFQDASQPGDSFVSELFGVPQSGSPFTLEFPLSSFVPRGGGPGHTDFRRVRYFQMSISAVSLLVVYPGPDQIGFSATIDRIRFGAAVPEPATAMLAGAFAFSICGAMARRRRCSHEHACLLIRWRFGPPF